MSNLYYRTMWMGLSFFLILFFSEGAALGQDSSRITVKGTNIPIEAALRQIEVQTGFNFVYGKPTLDDSEHVTINLSEASFSRVLAMLFKGRNITWQFRGRSVVLSRKTSSGMSGVLSTDSVPEISVLGFVTDEAGKPIPGATIGIKGSTLITISDSEGRFVMNGIKGNATLIISNIGYQKKEVVVKGGSNVMVKLKEQITELKNVEVISTGYQEITKNQVTGSIVKIDNAMLNRATGANILERIYDITSGLANNANDAGKELTVRGKASINGGNAPLIVVDNFPYEGDIGGINPNDVESITVLKDAAAAAIWGTRAGNGVIVITTKKGKYSSKLNVGVVANTTLISKPDLFYMPWLSSTGMIDLQKLRFDRGEYENHDDLYPSFGHFPVIPAAIEILLRAKRNGVDNPTSDPSILVELAELGQHDVRNDMNKYLMRTGAQQQYAVNVSGGTEKYSFYGSFGYDKETPVQVNTKSDRFTFNMGSNFRLSKKLEASAQIVHIRASSNQPVLSFSSLLTQNISPYTRLADQNGNALVVPFKYRLAYVDTASYPGLLDWHYRPLDELNNGEKIATGHDTRINASLKYLVLPWLKAEVQYQKQYTQQRTKDYYTSESFIVRDAINGTMFLNSSGKIEYPWPMGDYVKFSNAEMDNWNARGNIVVDKIWPRHRLNGLLGIEYRETKTDVIANELFGFDPGTNTSQAVNPTQSIPLRPSGVISFGAPINPQGLLFRYGSYYSNIIYSYLDKYFVSASGRIDQSNNFGVKANMRKTPLWSAGIGWAIHEENFYNLKWLPLLKLRASYGFTGNAIIGATSFATIRYTNDENYAPYRGIFFAEIQTPNNPGLKWERIKIVNVGLDFGMLENRLTGSVDFYRKNGLDLMGPILSDPTSGYPNYMGNQSSTKNRGVDVVLNSVNLHKGAFKWSTNLLFSFNKDRVVKYEGFQGEDAIGLMTGGVYKIDYPLNSVFSLRSAGLNPVDGSPRIFISDTIAGYDQILNVKSSDLKFYGSANPVYFGSLINNFEWRNVSLSFIIKYKLNYFFRRRSVDYLNLLDYGGVAHRDFEKRWQKKGDEGATTVPSLPVASEAIRDMAYQNSDVLVEKGDHIRLQDVRLGYTFNGNWMKRMRINSLGIFVYASNLGIIWRANKHGIDPDYYLFQSIPDAKRVTFGLTANL